MAKKSANYELMLVISLAKGEEAAVSIWEKFKAMIDSDAELGNVDEWGKRKLAYPINYETEALYYVVKFTASPEFPAELDRVMNITDGVLRSMITVVEE
ncbi:MAG: 30S ribosomal protein S6 [Oscillospiraceae bacterium]|nr:30S ribosomal protein S6 [Oscillospiraceae bacterium]